MKRIIEGVTYDTTTATEVFVHSNDHSQAWNGLYQTRHGAFFKVKCEHDGIEHTFTPMTDQEAQEHTEKHANHMVKKFFGPMPEYGAAERRLTVRIPASLARRVETAAAAQSTNVNRFIMRSLEKTLSQEPSKDR